MSHRASSQGVPLLIASFAIVALGLCALGCKGVTDLNKTIDNAANTLQSTAGKLGSDLQMATGNIDPIGVKKLLDQNEALRVQLIALQKRTQQFGPSVGVIQLSGARLLLRVESYRGKFSINAFSDMDQTNWVLNQFILSPENAARIDIATPIPLNPEVAFAQFCDFAHLPNDPLRTAANSAGTVNFVLLQYAIPAMKQFIASSVNAIPDRQIDLQNQMPPGDHWLTVQITPLANDPQTGNWSLRLQLVQQFPDLSEQTLRRGDWSSELDTFTLGQAIQRTLVIPIKVTPGTST